MLVKAISTDNFSLLRAAAHSSAKAFWNEFGIQSFRIPQPRITFGSPSAFVDSSSIGQVAFSVDS